MSLTSTAVINTTTSAYQVSVFPVMLTQELSGAFDFAETPLDFSAASRVLTVSPRKFTLGPGRRHAVTLRWNLYPLDHRSFAIGVVFQGIAEGQSGAVHVVTRLLSVNFLQLPGRYRVNGLFTGLYPEQLSPHDLRFLGRVKNTGDEVWTPSAGRFVIRNSLGRVVYAAPWRADVVLPGAQRDFPIDVGKVLPAGKYTATIAMRFGAERERTVPFTLVGPNRLPTPAVTVRNFNATGVIGQPSHITSEIVSSGTAPASVVVHLALFSTAKPAAPLATTTVSYRNLRPGSVADLARDVGPGLHNGSYRVFASWADPSGAHHMLEADFSATVARSAIEKILDFLRHHLALIILLVALLAMALLLAVVRRRQRRTEAELASIRAQMEAGGLGDDGEPPAAEQPKAPSAAP